MSEQPKTSVLRKMLAQDEPVAAEVPLTVARALRLSAARAAEESVSLKLTVQDVFEELLPLDALIERLSNELLLLKMQRGGEVCGLSAMDAGMVGAIVESQTMGWLSDGVPSPRPMTAVDASLSEPLVAGLLKEMAETIGETNLDGWIDDIEQKDQFLDLRQIGLTLAQATYRLLRMTIDLGIGERSGTFYLALPLPDAEPKLQPDREDAPAWAEAFPETIGQSKASLPVILNRFDAPLSMLENLEVGQVVPLPRCRVDSARMEMPDGTLIAKGRLGQMAGHLAFRLENPAPEVLEDLQGGAAPLAAPPLDMGMDAAPSLELPGELGEPVMELPGADDLDLGALGDDGGASDLELAGIGGGEDLDLSSLGQDEDAAELDLSALGSEEVVADIDLSGLGSDDADDVDLSGIDLSKLGKD